MQLTFDMWHDVFGWLEQRDLIACLGVSDQIHDVCIDLLMDPASLIEREDVQVIDAPPPNEECKGDTDAEQKCIDHPVLAAILKVELRETNMLKRYSHVPFGRMATKAHGPINLDRMTRLELQDDALESVHDIRNLHSFDLITSNSTKYSDQLKQYIEMCGKLSEVKLVINSARIPLEYFSMVRSLFITNTGNKIPDFCFGFDRLVGLREIVLNNIIMNNDDLKNLAGISQVRLHHIDGITDVSPLSRCLSIYLIECVNVGDISCLANVYQLYIVTCSKISFKDGSLSNIPMLYMHENGSLPNVGPLGYYVTKPNGSVYRKRYYHDQVCLGV